ncbi:hypothetical protein N9Z13_03135 [Luminiphilus sp.]|nr:hypothetical protein [Luminiphilus sp.]
MIRLSGIRNQILTLALIMFCLPLAFPERELAFLQLQFSVIMPLFLFLSLLSTTRYGIGLMYIYVCLIGLMPLGLPGSITGWMSMVCAGYFFGEYAIKDPALISSKLKPFLLLTILLSVWLCFKHYISPFTQAELSDYFQASSINTVPLLAVCTANLYCGFHYYVKCICVKSPDSYVDTDFPWIYGVIFAAILSTAIFGFRSGMLIFVTAAIIVWQACIHCHKVIGNVVMPTIFGLIILTVGDYFYDTLVEYVVPGRTELSVVVYELSKSSLRFDRMVNFWSVAALTKSNFDIWSQFLSFSALSDFTASLFPISLFFFIPALSLFKLIKYLRTPQRLHAITVMISASSSLIISLLQPDFYSVFTFFAISSLVYFGEKSRRVKDHEEWRRGLPIKC